MNESVMGRKECVVGKRKGRMGRLMVGQVELKRLGVNYGGEGCND